MMLDFVERSSGRPDPATKPSAGADIEALLRQLRQHRVRPRLVATARGAGSCGLALRIAVNQYLGSASVAVELNERLQDALAAGVPVTLSLCDVEHEPAVESSLEAFCMAVKTAMRDVYRARNLVGICLRSHILPIQAFLVITSMLGRGPRYVMLDSLQMQDHSDDRVQAMTDGNWLELRHRRNANCPTMAVYGESVRSRCPLLADEKTASVLPALAATVPADSAWLPLEIFLPDYSDGHGHLFIPILRDALHACIDINEKLAPFLAWTCDRQRRDLQANNRIALLLTGIGDLVCERKLDPGEIRCLRWVERIISAIQNELWEYSSELARKYDTLPSLMQSDPSNVWRNVEHKLEWSHRWQQTLLAQAVRNRNLLLLSPYSVLPSQQNSSPKFTDLLPVLAHADAISFGGMPDLSTWTVHHFSRFHRRAWTVIMRESCRTRIAAGA